VQASQPLWCKELLPYRNTIHGFIRPEPEKYFFFLRAKRPRRSGPPEKVKPLLERLKEFAEIIRSEAVKLLVEDYPTSHLHFPVFSGPIGHAEGKRESGPNSN
jgi:hypothetical protein